MLVVSVVAVLISTAAAWYPISHTNFSCEYEGGLSICAGDAVRQSFLVGSFSPDALKKIDLLFHTFEFAKFQYDFAVKSADRFKSAEFSPVGYAAGFGGHLAADLVGHHANGFLANSGDHEVSFALDGYIFFNIWGGNTSHPKLTYQPMGSEGITFVYEAITAFAQETKEVSPVTAAQILTAFTNHKNTEADRESKILLYSEDLIEGDLMKYSFCQVKTFSDVLKHLDLSCRWIAETKWWWNQLAGQSIDRKKVEKEVSDFVDLLYKNNGGTSC